MAAERDKNLAS